MKRRSLDLGGFPAEVVFVVLLCAVLACASLTAAPAWAADSEVAVSAQATGTEDAPEFRVLESNASHTLVEITIPKPEATRVTVDGREFDLLTVPGASPFGEAGAPLLAVDGTMIAVPPASGVSMRVLEETQVSLGTYDLPSVSAICREPGEKALFDEAAFAHDGFLPEASVTVGEPAIMRDFRIVALRVFPLSYNAATDEVLATTRLLVELDYSEAGRANVKTTDRPPTRSYEPLYRSLIANYEFVKPRYESDSRGKYLIITHDNYYASVLPLAEWKHRRGMEVEIAKTSVIGSTTTAIKNYIQTAYDTWDVPPEYVLLVGDTEYVPTFGGYWDKTDDEYAQLEGTDYLVDLHLGRLSCDTVGQCDLIVAKTLGYERTPTGLMSNPDWFRSATLIISDDWPPDQNYWNDTWHAHNLMTQANFAQIDTLFDRNGSDAGDVHAAVTAGRVLVNYRGQAGSNWVSPFSCNPNSTSPGYKLPVVMSATCATGDFGSDGYPCETWMRAGTIAAPKGSVAFLGTGRSDFSVSAERSAVDQAFYTALFANGMHTIGEALNYAKYQFYVLFFDQSEYTGWNCQGDPELDVWTATPNAVTVSHPPTVPVGPSDFHVEVSLAGQPVVMARICAWADGEVYASGVSDHDGGCTLSISPTEAESLYVTVSGHNLLPYEASVPVVLAGPYLVYGDHEIDDSVGGNDDGLLSPGETIELTVTLENTGPDVAAGVIGVLSSADAYATVIDSSAVYGTIVGGGSGVNVAPFRFVVDESCPNGHGLSFSMSASDAARTSWGISLPPIEVAAADLAHVSTTVDDGAPGGNGNGTLDPGETAWLEITIENVGPIGVDGVAGVLSSDDPYVAVSDPDGVFGSVPPSGSASSQTHSFRVSASPTAPPSQVVSFDLTTSGDGGTYGHSEIVIIDLVLGGSVVEGPCGPDSYGYFAYDTSDGWTGQAPAYEWVEITGVGAQVISVTNQDAATTARPLPFTFKYYGTNYTQVSVNSNGFLAMGVTDYRFGDNSEIPSPHGPAAMISPFWDDLSPNVSGDIYEWYDSANDRYVVQFDEVVHNSGGNPETFEVVFYDPAVYSTATGDGIIVMQYQDVSLVSQCTIGIENPGQTDGIQYVYNNSYDPAAAPVVDGQAIKYTTEGPTAPPVWLVIAGSEIDDSAGGNGNGIAEPGETVDITLTIENLGLSTASAVSAALSTSDPDATVVNGTASFGSIAGGGMAMNVAPLTVAIAAEPADATIEFDVHLSTGLRYDSWDVLVLEIDTIGTGIDGDDETPAAFALRQNAPNPFRDGTVIAFDLAAPSRACLEVYNVAGRKVASVVDDEFGAGRHTVRWDGRDTSGREVSAGIYFYRLEAGSNQSMKKMILLK